MSLPPSAFVESLIRFLMPFFIGTAVDADAARSEILETLASYGGRTRAEMLNAARIIAFSLSTLDVLAEAKTADLSPSLRVRVRGCANGLNRSTIQNEKVLENRLASDLPQCADTLQEPVNDIPDAETQATINHARATIQAYRNRATGARRAPTPAQEQRNKQLWAGAMMDALKQMGLPNGPTASG